MAIFALLGVCEYRVHTVTCKRGQVVLRMVKLETGTLVVHPLPSADGHLVTKLTSGMIQRLVYCEEHRLRGCVKGIIFLLGVSFTSVLREKLKLPI